MAVPIMNWWRVRTPSNSSSNKSGSSPLGEETKSPLQKGVWVQFPFGAKFRKATGYTRSRLIMAPGASDHSTYSSLYRYVYSSTPGGNIGNWRTANWSFRLNPDFAIPSINGAPAIETYERNEAVTKALNEIADGKAQLGEGLATLGQTVRLFKNPVDGLIKGIRKIYNDRDLRPYLLKSYRDMLRAGVSKTVANRYLEYVYGIVPLMQDIYGVSELAKSQLPLGQFLHGKGQAKRELSSGDMEYSNVSAAQMEFYRNIKGNSVSRCHLWATLDPNYSGTRALNQLGLLNPVSVIWELVPYSFLIDWALPIGPVLSALTAPAGLNYVNGSISRRVTANWLWEAGGRPSGQPYGGSLANAQCRYEGYRRDVITSWPRPGLWFDSDPLRLASDKSDRVFKALALAIAGLPKRGIRYA